MTGQQPAPEAVEAVADAIRAIDGPATLGGSDVAAGVLAFIRDAIHRDGDDADAIREALGLSWQPNYSTAPHRDRRRVVGEWQEPCVCVGIDEAPGCDHK